MKHKIDVVLIFLGSVWVPVLSASCIDSKTTTRYPGLCDIAAAQIWQSEKKSGAIESESEVKVSPTLGLDALIEAFERDENVGDVYEGFQLAEFECELLKVKEKGGSRWGTENKRYYQELDTCRLAEECFEQSVFQNVILIYNNPIYGFSRLRIMHDGFAELFERDDMWKGLLHAYEHLGSRLNTASELSTIVVTAGTFEAFTHFYTHPEYKKQIRGREEPFLRANLGVLRKFSLYLEECGHEQLETGGSVGFFREPCSVAQVALMLAKQIQPQIYVEIEPEIKSVTWSQRQSFHELKAYLDLVIGRLSRISESSV